MKMGLIGGAPSTGSSVFRRLLNRHPAIFCGPETTLFSKYLLYQNWEVHKWHILDKLPKLVNYDFHYYDNIHLTKQESGVTDEELASWLEESATFASFIETYIQRQLKPSDKTVWFEKTPANAWMYDSFQSIFSDSYFIHMARNPYDCIASIMARGVEEYYAVSRYLLNVSMALRHKEYKGNIMVKYEDLVQDHQGVMNGVYRFLGQQEFDVEQITDAVFDDDTPQIFSWKYSEISTVGKGSVGRFETLPVGKKDMIIKTCNALRISDDFCAKHNLQVISIEEICDTCDYQFIDNASGSIPPGLAWSRRVDKLKRSLTSHPLKDCYPIDVL